MKDNVKRTVDSRQVSHEATDAEAHAIEAHAVDAHAALWQQFIAGTAEEREVARERLVRAHIGLVRHIARQIMPSGGDPTDLEDAVSAGMFGLISALHGFDPSRGLAFSTFASPRIRGAILDDLRQQDPVPRSIRRKARLVTKGRAALQRHLGRPATDSELASHLGLDLEVFHAWEDQIGSAVAVPWEGQGRDDSADDVVMLSERVADEDGESIDDLLTHEQEVAILRDTILRLTPQEQTVLSLYYFEDMNNGQIGQIMGLTQSRVSQIRLGAVKQLQHMLTSRRMYVA